MKRTTYLSTIALVLCLLTGSFWGCHREKEEPLFVDKGLRTVLGDQLQGEPFSVETMEKALKNLNAKLPGNASKSGRVLTSLTPTHYYVRFRLNDIDQLSTLEQTGYDFWDVPLDREVVEQGDYYQDPSIPSDQITYYYTLVPYGQTIPAVGQVTVLQNLFLTTADAGDEQDPETPDPWNPTDPYCYDEFGNAYVCGSNPRRYLRIGGKENNSLNASRQLLEAGIDPLDLYNEAMRITGNQSEMMEKQPAPSPQRSARRYNPQGRITVAETQLGTNVPLRGVTVKARRFFKLGTATTDNNGDFYINTPYRNKATVLLKFKNDRATVRGINAVWRVWEFVFPVKQRMGLFTQTEMENIVHNIPYNANAGSAEGERWVAATFLNNLAEMHDYCAANNIPTPPQQLTVWVSSAITRAAATPMLRQLTDWSLIDAALNLFLSEITRPATDIPSIRLIVRKNLPDITCRYGGNGAVTRNSFALTETFYHELAHSVHYRRVGRDFWREYIRTIVTNQVNTGDPYAVRGTQGDNLIAVSEAWGFFAGNAFSMIKYPEAAQPEAFRNRRNFLENQVPIRVTGQFNEFGATPPRGWIPWGIHEDLRDIGEPAFTTVTDNANGYNIQQIFNAYVFGVGTMQRFREELLRSNNNLQAPQVNQLIDSYAW